jgi:PPM family protein phosphatase
MSVEAFAQSDVGAVRKTNEDAYAIAPDLGFYLVADGMGGQAAGEVASSTAAKEILDFVRDSDAGEDRTWDDPYDRSLSHGHNRLHVAFLRANAAIRLAAADDAAKQGMGTTAVAGLISGNTLEIAHIGDSRAYLWRDGKLTQLTQDHTWINEQVENGLLTPEEAKGHPYRNIITRALGASRNLHVDHLDQPLQDGDIVLFCTDGLSGMIEDEEIATILNLGEGDLEETTASLIRTANDKGGMDNITVLLIRYSN